MEKYLKSKIHADNVAYTVSCRDDVPYFIMKTGVRYFKTVFHPVLGAKKQKIPLLKGYIFYTHCDNNLSWTNLKLCLLSRDIIIITKLSEHIFQFCTDTWFAHGFVDFLKGNRQKTETLSISYQQKIG